MSKTALTLAWITGATQALGAAFERGENLSPDEAARDIWAALSPVDASVLLFGATPSGV